MKNKLLISSILMPLLLCAQAPGYMGKKVFMGGGVTYAPVLAGFFTEYEIEYDDPGKDYTTYKGETKSIFLPPLSYNACIQFVITEHSTLQFGVGFQKIGLVTADAVEYESDEYYTPDPYYGKPYHSDFTGPVKFDYARASYTRLSFGHTYSMATAPIGVFYGNTLNFLIANIEAVDVNGKNYNITQAYDFGYSFTYGYRRVIKDALVLETATDFNFYFGGFIGYFGSKINEAPVDKMKHFTLSSHYFNNIATLRVSAYYLF